MNAHEALSLVESVLRRLIHAVLDDDWRTSGKIDLAALNGKHKAEIARRKGAVISNDLLAYIEFYQLKELILEYWDKFKPILKDQAAFKVYMGKLEASETRQCIAESCFPTSGTLCKA